MGPGNTAPGVPVAGRPAADDVPGNGGPRSAATRRAILGAARSAFAAHGYEQATIRAIAAAAGGDASMVMRYFGSKAGLFALAATADLVVPDLRAVPPAERGQVLARYLVDRWEDTSRDDELILLMRTAVTSEAVAAQLQDVLARLVTAPVAALGISDAADRAALIGSQLLGLALCRYILRQEPLASMTAERVTAAVAPSVQRYLDAPLPGVAARTRLTRPGPAEALGVTLGGDDPHRRGAAVDEPGDHVADHAELLVARHREDQVVDPAHRGQHPGHRRLARRRQPQPGDPVVPRVGPLLDQPPSRQLRPLAGHERHADVQVRGHRGDAGAGLALDLAQRGEQGELRAAEAGLLAEVLTRLGHPLADGKQVVHQLAERVVVAVRGEDGIGCREVVRGPAHK
jgi:AcrR family transcriptional regulator